MSNVNVTFVHTTFGLGTFVHISNISDVTDPIFTKLFGPNIFGGWNIFRPKELRSQFLLLKIFWSQFLFWPNFFYPKLFLTQFLPTFFFNPNFFDPKFFGSTFFNQNFLIQKFFLTQIFLHPSFFCTQIFLELNQNWTFVLDLVC